jgi:hypothetical protein
MDEKAAEMERQRAAEFEKKRREELLKQQEKQKAQGKIIFVTFLFISYATLL